MGRLLACAALLAPLLARVAASGAATESEIQRLEDESTTSLCLLQKEMVVSIQPPDYHGPYLDDKGWDEWDKRYVDDAVRGPFFRDTLDTTTPAAKPTAAPVASPLDSLMAPAAVPAPAAAPRYDQWWHSVSWSAALFGLLTVWVMFFLLTGLQSHKGIQMTTQATLNNIVAFFIAKMLFAAVCLFMAAVFQAKGAEESLFHERLEKTVPREALLASIARAVVILILVKGSMNFCRCCCYQEGAMCLIAGIGAPLIGFALVDACGMLLRLCVDYEQVGLMAYALVALCPTLFVAVLFALRETWNHFACCESFFAHLTGAVEGSPQDHYKREAVDLETTSFCMLTGFAIFKVAERAILGEPPLARDASAAETPMEVLQLAAVAGALALAQLPLGFWRAHPVLVPERIVHLLDGCSPWQLGAIPLPLRVLDLLEGFAMMGSGWCFLGTFSWATSASSVLQHGLLQTGATTAPLLAALGASALVAVLLCALGCWAGVEGPSPLHHQGSHERYSHWLISSALGLLGGLAWAVCFIHAARDLALNVPDHQQSVEGSICLALTAFVVPVWGRVLLPPRKLLADEAIVSSQLN